MLDARGPAAGDEVDRYRLEAPLGRGAQGSVWLARHRSLQSLHALKFVEISSEAGRQRVRREGQVQARLDHPNLVPVTDALEGKGSVVLVMPYVAGPTLADWLAAHRPTPTQAAGLLSGILAGLAHAHTHGVVHRDLKPSNILLCGDGDSLVPRIADFGIARDLEFTGSLTATGDALGSVHYMAPEQASDAGQADARADIYAVGCIAYELYTGARPFSGSQLMEILAAKAGGHFVPVRQRAPGVGIDVAQVIEWCLQPLPRDRPASCGDLHAALAGVDVGTARAGPASGRHSAHVRVAAGWGALAVVGAGVALAFVSPWGFAVEYPHADGYVLRLDGTSWVEVPAAPALGIQGALTIAAWIRPEAWQYGDLFPVLDRIWRLDVLPDRMVFTAAKRTGSPHPVTTTLGEWRHVAVSYAPHVREVRWYVDGRLQEARPYSEPLWDAHDDPTLALAIGASPFGRFEGAQGSIDDVFVFERELAEEDILHLARGELVDTADLIGAWHFDEGEGDVARDSGPGGHHGRVIGPAQWRRPTELDP